MRQEETSTTSTGHKSINVHHQKLDAIASEILPCRDLSLIIFFLYPQELGTFLRSALLLPGLPHSVTSFNL